MFIQPISKKAADLFKAGITQEERNSIIINSGKPIAKEMMDLKSGNMYFCPYIGKYRLGGEDPNNLVKFKTADKAFEFAKKYYKEWMGNRIVNK